MTKEEARQYAQKLLSESGVPDEDATRYLKLFENDKFVHGFIPRPEVDRALDSERSKASAAIQRTEYLEKEWLPKAESAYQKNLQGIALLEKYQKAYGAIEDGGDMRRAASETGLTLDKVQELLDSRLNTALSQHGQAAMDLMDVREDYMDKFKRRMPVKDFEKFVEGQQKTGQFAGLRSAYRDFIKDDLEKVRTTATADREKQLRAEIEKDVLSRYKLPADPRPREAHLLFDRDKMKEEAGKVSAREEFMNILNDPEPETLGKRFPG